MTMHDLFRLMVKQNASDLLISVGAPPSLKIDGQVLPVKADPLTPDVARDLVFSIMTEVQHAEFELDNELNFAVTPADIGRFRINVFRQRNHVGLVARRISSEIPSLEALGLPVATLEKIAMTKIGLVLFVGGTGTGKTTTQAAMVGYRNQHTRGHIITIEDPVEYVFEDNQCIIEQREIGLDTPSYEHSLKHVMRQDPDVIMVGEMRDATSFRAAMSAADTGHLVLSTLHTIDAPQSISRVLDFFPADERESVRKQMIGTLKAIICQRMTVRKDGNVIPAIEIMINTPTISKLINENRLEKLHVAIETGTDDGMQNFNQSLFQLVKDDIITKEEALEKATNAQALEMNFKGIFLSEGSRILN